MATVGGVQGNPMFLTVPAAGCGCATLSGSVSET